MNIIFLLPPIVTFGGVYMLFKSDFLFLLHPIRTLRALASSFREKSARRSLSLALAGTLGIGNIVGVAFGIIAGGAGSVFWLLVSALFAMALKYSETSLSADFKVGGRGGMAIVIKSTFFRLGGFLSGSYAALCLLLSLIMGAALQSASAAECAREAVGMPRSTFGFLFVILVLLSVFGGASVIERITVAVIPLAVAIYLFLAFWVIGENFSRLPDVASLILSSAFSVKSVGGGIVGFLASRSVREGFARGLLSNEAGAGTSSMAHSRSTLHPAAVGLFGMCEVFLDTVILCPITALAILLAVPDWSSYSHGMSLVFDSIGRVLGVWSGYLLLFSILAFAYSTVICWYYYGSECKKFVFSKCVFPFLPIYLFFVYLGSVASLDFFVPAADIVLLFLTVLSLSAVIKNSDRIVALSENFGLISPRF